MFVFRNPEFHFMFPMHYFVTMRGTRPFCLDFLKQIYNHDRLGVIILLWTLEDVIWHLVMLSMDSLFKSYLTYSFRRHPFSTPWKHQKTVKFSDVLGA